MLFRSQPGRSNLHSLRSLERSGSPRESCGCDSSRGLHVASKSLQTVQSSSPWHNDRSGHHDVGGRVCHDIPVDRSSDGPLAHSRCNHAVEAVVRGTDGSCRRQARSPRVLSATQNPAPRNAASSGARWKIATTRRDGITFTAMSFLPSRSARAAVIFGMLLISTRWALGILPHVQRRTALPSPVDLRSLFPCTLQLSRRVRTLNGRNHIRLDHSVRPPPCRV